MRPSIIVIIQTKYVQCFSQKLTEETEKVLKQIFSFADKIKAYIWNSQCQKIYCM